MRRTLAAMAALMLAGCGEGGVAPPARPAPHIPVPLAAPPGPAAIAGQSARALIAQFGPPQIDMQEGAARKLQFLGQACVLDAYLYPRERGEPVVTYFDARRRDGAPIDAASCAGTLQRIAPR